MRMIVPDQFRTACPFGLVRGDERGGINLKPCCGRIRHIRASLHPLHRLYRPEQQPADLNAWRFRRVRADRGDGFA